MRHVRYHVGVRPAPAGLAGVPGSRGACSVRGPAPVRAQPGGLIRLGRPCAACPAARRLHPTSPRAAAALESGAAIALQPQGGLQKGGGASRSANEPSSNCQPVGHMDRGKRCAFCDSMPATQEAPARLPPLCCAAAGAPAAGAAPGGAAPPRLLPCGRLRWCPTALAPLRLLLAL